MPPAAKNGMADAMPFFEAVKKDSFLTVSPPETSSGGQGISFQGVTFQGFCSTLRQKAIRIVAICSRVALSCGHR